MIPRIRPDAIPPHVTLAFGLVAVATLLVAPTFPIRAGTRPQPTPTAELIYGPAVQQPTFPPVPWAIDNMPIMTPPPQPVWSLDTHGNGVVSISGSLSVTPPFAYDFYPPLVYAVPTPAHPLVDANGECVGVADLRAQLAALSARVVELETHAALLSTDLSFAYGNGDVVYVKDAAGHGFGVDDGQPFWFSHRLSRPRTLRDLLQPGWDAQPDK
jgi:hypothetical protein